MISRGSAVEGPIFVPVFGRRQNLLYTIALLLDEIRNEVFKKGCIGSESAAPHHIMFQSLKCSNPTCQRTKGVDGKKLKQCKRCYGAQYCGKDCQRIHWPTHKKICCSKMKTPSPSHHPETTTTENG